MGKQEQPILLQSDCDLNLASSSNACLVDKIINTWESISDKNVHERKI